MTTMNEADALAHYGVLGMKWGVRKDRGHEGERARAGTIKRADKKYEKSLSGQKGWIAVQNVMADQMNARLDTLNNSPKYKDKHPLAPGNGKLAESYLSDYEKLVEESAKSAEEVFGTNASGTVRIDINRVGSGLETFYEARLREINHSEFDGGYLKITPNFNAKGLISSQTIETIVEEGSIAHAFFIENREDILVHYGVLGMKWGVRKAERKALNTRNENYTDQQVKRDKQVYGARGSKRINKSLNEGNRISVARGDETVRRNAALRTNRPARTAGKVTGTVVGAGAGYVGHRLLSQVLVSPEVVRWSTRLLGNSEAYLVTSLLTSPYTRLAVAGGAARVGNLLGGDAAVAVNMRARGYDPDRK